MSASSKRPISIFHQHSHVGFFKRQRSIQYTMDNSNLTPVKADFGQYSGTIRLYTSNLTSESDLVAEIHQVLSQLVQRHEETDSAVFESDVFEIDLLRLTTPASAHGPVGKFVVAPKSGMRDFFRPVLVYMSDMVGETRHPRRPLLFILDCLKETLTFVIPKVLDTPVQWDVCVRILQQSSAIKPTPFDVWNGAMHAKQPDFRSLYERVVLVLGQIRGAYAGVEAQQAVDIVDG